MTFDSEGEPTFDPRFRLFRPFPAKFLLPPDLEDEEEAEVCQFPDYEEHPMMTQPYDFTLRLDKFMGSYIKRYRNSQALEGNWIAYSKDYKWEGVCMSEYRFKRPLLEASRMVHWIIVSFSDRIDTRFPHMKCVLLSNNNGGDELLRSELLAITRLMGQRLGMRLSKEHDIAPILLFSLMGRQHARILQAHFDGTDLIVLKSKLFDFRTKDDEALALFAQWAYSEPVGNTRREEPAQPESETQPEPEAKVKPAAPPEHEGQPETKPHSVPEDN